MSTGIAGTGNLETEKELAQFAILVFILRQFQLLHPSCLKICFKISSKTE